MTTFIILVAALSLVVLLMKEYGWTDLTGNTRNDLVFEQRNKAYGAYEIRQKYSNRLIVAFFGVLAIMTMAAFAPKYLIHSVPENKLHTKGNDGGIIIDEIEIPKEKKKEEIFEQPKEKPQQQQQDQKNDISTTANTNPVATTQQQEKDTTQKDDKAIVSNTTHKGTDTLGTGSNVVNTNGCLNCGTTTGGNGNSKSEPLSPAEVTVDAEYPGGLNKYLEKHLNYPELAAESGIEGKVYVEFVVNEDGSVKVYGVKKKGNALLDEEAVRVLANTKGWKPAEFNGQPVKVRKVQPINFKLK